MNPVPLFLIIVTLPLLLGGCGEKPVHPSKLVKRQGIIYLVDSEKPFTGKSLALHDNGQKKSEENYKRGKPDGVFITWYENGRKEMESNWKDGQMNGLQRGWHENGQKATEGLIKDGKPVSAKNWNSKGEPVNSFKETGLRAVYYGELEFREGVFYLKGVDTRYTGNAIALYENGQKKAEDNFKDGKRDGLQLFWHQNGQKKGEINWKNGKQNGLYLGWYENGKKAMEEKYKDGKPYGSYMAWHKNGQKRSEGNYKNGKREGLFVDWHKNGQKSAEMNYKDDKWDGLHRGWHENGQILREANYKDGERVEGSRKFWNNKGEEVSNSIEAFK